MGTELAKACWGIVWRVLVVVAVGVGLAVVIAVAIKRHNEAVERGEG